MEHNLAPADLVQAYLQEKTLSESLAEQLEKCQERKNEFEFAIRNELLEPNQCVPLLIDGETLVQLVGGYLQICAVTKL